jgi:carbon-monoxide dehydrogenase medium subunit
MYAPEFSYHRATSIAEVGSLLERHAGAKILAGGHSLIPLLKLRLASPPALIDIGRIAELKGIAVKGSVLKIGALVTHQELASSPLVREHCPALAEAAAHVGDPAVRNRGTIGGNVAHGDPASDLPIVLTAVGARFAAVGPKGTRTIEVGGFFQGLMTTALADRELLTEIEIPVKAAGQGMAYAKFEHAASRYAVIGVAAAIIVSAGTCTAASIAIGGLVPAAVRATAVEQALAGKTLSADAVASAADQVGRDLGRDILGDIFASAEYRKAVAPVWVRRAVTAAAERAR